MVHNPTTTNLTLTSLLEGGTQVMSSISCSDSSWLNLKPMMVLNAQYNLMMDIPCMVGFARDMLSV